jgi:uncharacterized SAM-binding protein YcdF (DUF218 family)
MIFILSKLIVYVIQPAIWVFVLLLFAIFKKNKRTRKQLFWCATIVLLFFSNSFIVGKVFNAYEGNPPPHQRYDIGIVLGGFAGYDKKKKEIVFSNAADRFYKTIELYQNGDIDQILISGGNANLIDNEAKEADIAADYLKKIGIPDTAILIENQSRNTVENAAFSRKLIEKVNPNAKVLVITSAWHIPRVRVIFSKHFKKDIYFYPTNYIGKTSYSLSDMLLPSVNAFISWQLILKEWVGLFVDRYRA